MYKESLPVSTGRMKNRMAVTPTVESPIIREDRRNPYMNDHLQNAVADHLPQIIDIARNVVSLK